MSALDRLVGASLGLRARRIRLPRRRRSAARVLAVAGPLLVAVGLLPFRSSLGLAGFLFCTLLAVVAVAVIGGVRPALTAVVVGFLAGAFLHKPPYGDLRIYRPVDLVALIAFVVVGGGIGILVDDLTRLAEEQAALRRVATLVAGAAPPENVFAAITEEAGKLLPADITNLNRYEPDGTVTIVGSWSRAGDSIPVGTRLDIGAARATGSNSAVGSPVIVEGRLWGIMLAASKSERPLAPRIEARLVDFTDLLATAIANAESRADLAASRARIVGAADETRRRLERDLHDGAQQQLVSVALRLRAARGAVPAELEELSGELSRVAEGLTSALNNLREIARGVHPAILAEGGLGPALKTLVRRSPLSVELAVRADARLPERVEVAAYYVVSETLTNAAKHAHASVVRVDVHAVEDVLRLSVCDDGDGGADPARGSGLVGLKDRVEALGGTISVKSPLGAGTSVDVELPLDDEI
jgi:signal transduction histidine kinase